MTGRESFFFDWENLDRCEEQERMGERPEVEKRPGIYKVKPGPKLVVYQSLPRFTKIGVFDRT